MYYEIYIDQLFLENLLLMVLLLRTWSKQQNCFLSWKRIWGISVLGAVAVCAVIFFRPEINAGPGAESLCMLLPLYLSRNSISFREKYRTQKESGRISGGNKRKQGEALLSYIGTAVFYGGAIQWSAAFWNLPTIPAAFLACITAEGLIQKQRKRMVLEECRAEVTLEDQGDRWELTGLIDTGNHLCEPLTGRPVSILNGREAEKLVRFCRIQKEQNGYLYIPFHSVGTEKGWMMGMTIDVMTIRYGGEEIRILHPVLAVSTEPVGADGQYQMILNPLHLLGPEIQGKE